MLVGTLFLVFLTFMHNFVSFFIEKDLKTPMISTSEWGVERLSAGQNTQHKPLAASIK